MRLRCAIGLLGVTLVGAAERPAMASPGEEESSTLVAGTAAVVDVGGWGQAGGGIAIAHRRRVGPTWLVAEYDGLVVEQVSGPEHTGIAHRLGLGIEHEVTGFLVDDRSLDVVFVLRGQVGVEHMVGPVAHWRPDLALGFAAEYRGRGRPVHDGQRYYGLEIGVRLIAAQPARTEPVALARGGTVPAPSGVDVGMLVDLGFRWGR